MQSKSSDTKKSCPSEVHSPSKSDQPVGANSDIYVQSAPIEQLSDAAMNILTTSLAALKEASAFAVRIPYLSPIAGLILQALAMRDEVQQFKGEWSSVMRRLSGVASIVVGFEAACQMHNLREEDLPDGLCILLESLHTELCDIGFALKQCEEIRGLRRYLLRTEMLGKIKKYDSNLSQILQIFQANLLLDVRLAQIAQGHEHIYTGPKEVATRTHRPIAPPPAPQTFVGRDAELNQIIRMIFDNIRSHPARIAILGPGGFGKTSLANAVLTHDQVLKHYGDARYFVPCESASSPGALLAKLGKVLGIEESTADTLWAHILDVLCSKKSILCFDNFESVWDQPEEVKQSVEMDLSRITELCHVTVLITMRGSERPAGTKWTQPFLEPLKTLNRDAAKRVWEQITGYYDMFSEKLLDAVENVPLAVDLLAHLAQGQRTKLLWDEWNLKYIKLIKRGHMNRLSDLEFSIQLSIDSERMKANPSAKALLAVLSMLPDGIHINHVAKFTKVLSDIDVGQCLGVLQKCSLIRLKEDKYQAHSIICQFCINQGLILAKHKASLEEHYLKLASYDRQKGSQIYEEMVLEVHNTKSVLLGILKSKYSEQSRLINAIVTLTQFCASIGDFDITLLNQANQFIEYNNGAKSLSIKCFQVWGELYYYAADMESAKDKLQEAEKLCLTYNNNYRQHGSILTILGQIYLSQHKLNEAADSFQRALHLYQIINNISGQGDNYERLGMIYVLQNKLNDAKAYFQKALKYYEASDNKSGQGNVYLGLGEINLNQNKLKEAKDHFQEALRLHKAANNHLSQGHDYKGLGDVYLRQNKLSDAEESFQKALELHKAVKATVDQGNDHRGLGDLYLQQKRLTKAENSYKSALELYTIAGNIPSQGNALNRLGHIYLMKSQLKEAKTMFEKALEIHEHIQAKGWEREDKEYLNQILSLLTKDVKSRNNSVMHTKG